MSDSLRKLHLWLCVATLFVMGLHAVTGWGTGNLGWIFFGIAMVVSGIPHGAVDHVVFAQKKDHIPWFPFLKMYLGLMAAYLVLWWLFPQISLVIFLLLTCYHFGQSEWYFAQTADAYWPKTVLYMTWGAFILGSMLLFHWQMSLDILGDLAPYATEVPPDSLWYGWIACGVAAGVVSGWAFWVKAISGRDLAWEWSTTLLLVALSAWTPLPVAFAVYFAGWHALKAIQAEGATLFQEVARPWRTWIKAALPFSALSLVGIGGMVALTMYGLLPAHPALVFFVAISVLTLPHMIFMHKMYLQNAQTASS